MNYLHGLEVVGCVVAAFVFIFSFIAAIILICEKPKYGLPIVAVVALIALFILGSLA